MSLNSTAITPANLKTHLEDGDPTTWVLESVTAPTFRTTSGPIHNMIKMINGKKMGNYYICDWQIYLYHADRDAVFVLMQMIKEYPGKQAFDPCGISEPKFRELDATQRQYAWLVEFTTWQAMN